MLGILELLTRADLDDIEAAISKRHSDHGVMGRQTATADAAERIHAIVEAAWARRRLAEASESAK